MKRFLHFFLLAACFITTAQVFAATRIVYFDNQNNWTEVHAYTWNSQNGNENNGWPGEQITTINSDNLFVYEITNDAYDKIIFNNGSNAAQTKDLTIVNGKTYNPNGLVTVYFDNYKADWKNAHIYYWGAEKKSAEYPGEPLPALSDDVTLWSYQIPEGSKFIFNDGENAPKTGDLEDYNKIYYGTGDTSYPLNVYMIGNIKLYDEAETHIWENTWGGAKLKYKGKGIYEIERIEMLPQSENDMTSQFRFITNLDSNWNNNGTNYIAEDDNKFTEGGTSNVTEKTGDDNNWVFETKKCGNEHYSTIDLVLNLDKMTLSSKASTGVESITEDNTNAPAEYFNLQGVKVNNPENGLYIVRQGNKVSKQYIR